jgi:tight adherence protein C
VSALGAVLGLVAAAGLLLAVAWSPPLRRATLDQRLAPYLPGPVEERSALRAAAAGAARAVDRLVGGRLSVRRRLVALADPRSVEDIRLEQVVWGAAGIGAGAVGAALLAVLTARVSLPAGTVLALGGGMTGVLARDHALSRRVQRRRAAVLAELPAVAELLALAVTAGEGAVGALDRVCRSTRGELTGDLADVLGRVRAGEPLERALAGLRDRTGVPALARFVDGVVVALDRGTPLAEVLRAQAGDARAAGRRALLESGGRREIAMLAPVVFGILPVTVLFALFPGLVSITRLAG